MAQFTLTKDEASMSPCSGLLRQMSGGIETLSILK